MTRKYSNDNGYSTSAAIPKNPWTASRCSRLLRPLEAKLIYLRKYAFSSSQAHEFDCGYPSSYTTGITSATDDIPWRTTRARKTYTGRRTAASKVHSGDPRNGMPRSSRPDVVLPTPFLARMRGESEPLDVQKDVASSLAFEQNANKTNPAKRIKQSKTCTTANAVESAITAFLTLVQLTQEGCNTKSHPRSLVHMCLSAVPAHIQDETQYRTAQDQDDKSDVAAETYDWLEDFVRTSGAQWDCLRSAVRAHGIHLFRNVVAEGLIEDAEFASLLHHPLVYGSPDVVQSIVSAKYAADCQRPSHLVRDSAVSSVFSPTSALSTWGMGQTPASFWYRASALFIDKAGSMSMMSSNPIMTLRNEALRSMAAGVNFAGGLTAARFLEMYFLCSAGVDPWAADYVDCRLKWRRKSCLPFARPPAPTGRLPKEGAQAEILSVSGAVLEKCTILLVQGCVGASAPDQWLGYASRVAVRVIRGASFGVMRACSSCEYRKTATYAGLLPIAAVVLMADFINLLVLPRGDATDDARYVSRQEHFKFIAALVREEQASTMRVKKTLDSITTLVRDTAIYCEQTQRDCGFRILKQVVADLIGELSIGESERPLAKQIALDATLMFASVLREGEHLAYAREVEMTIGKVRLTFDPALGGNGATMDEKPAAGIRWEQGLCEWVVATPFQKAQGPHAAEHDQGPLHPSPLVRLRPRPAPKASVQPLASLRQKRKRAASPAPGDMDGKLNDGQSSGDDLDQTPPRKLPMPRMPQPRFALDHADVDEEDELSLHHPPPLKEITNFC